MPDTRETAGPATHAIEPGSPRYFAWLYAAGERDLLAALFEIEQEIESSLRPDLDHHVAHLRLAWWLEESARFAQGRTVHPAARRLGELTSARAREIDLRGLVEATAWDLACATAETRAELERHCARWAGAMIVPLARTPAEAGAARACGAALREMELLSRLAADARRGRLRLPLDELDALGLEPGALATPPWPAPLASHVRQRLGTLHGALRDSLRGFDAPALHAWAGVTSASARRLVRALPQLPRARRFAGLGNAVHAWRAARAALQGSVRLP